jgi:hypothetical protein
MPLWIYIDKVLIVVEILIMEAGNQKIPETNILHMIIDTDQSEA